MIALPLKHFNSIKVRLEQKGPEGSRPYARQFQFHKGTIRTPPYVDKDGYYYKISIP